MNQSIHIVDLLLYLNGEPESVFAYAKTMTHDIEVEDNLCAVIRYKNGSMGTLEVSTSAAPGFPKKLELTGSKGSVILEEDNFIRWSFEEKLPEDEQITLATDVSAAGGSNPTAISSVGHSAQIRDLADAILQNRPPQLDGKEGRKAVALICGIYESARTGKPFVFGE